MYSRIFVAGMLIALLAAFAVIPFIPFAPVHVYAAGNPTISITTSNGSTVCQSAFSQSYPTPATATWNVTTDTCAVSGALVYFPCVPIYNLPCASPFPIVDIGAGVTLNVSQSSSYGGYGIDNDGGIINNYGTISVRGFLIGIINSGTINNFGTMTGIGFGILPDGVSGGYGIENQNVTNNWGTIIGYGGNGLDGSSRSIGSTSNGGTGGNGGIGIYNNAYGYSGIINNWGTITGQGGSGGNGGNAYCTPTSVPICFGNGGNGGYGGNGIENNGTVNNWGTINGTGGGGSGGGSGFLGGHDGHGGDGIYIASYYGTINNWGTITGDGGIGSSPWSTGFGNGGTGIFNGEIVSNWGTINSYGGNGLFCNGGGGSGGYGGNGMQNNDTVNNLGTINGYGGTGAGDCGGYNGIGGDGISNLWGTINNEATINAYGGTGGNGSSYFCGFGTCYVAPGNGGNGIKDGAIVNNEGTISGYSGNHGYGNNAYRGNGIDNPSTGSSGPPTINNYCGVTLTYDYYLGTAPVDISCHTVTFDQSGIPSSATWWVAASWGPFILPHNHSGTGESIFMSAVGSLNYSYFSPLTSSGMTYVCQSGCFGTSSISSDMTFAATYSTPSVTTTVVLEGGSAHANQPSTGVNVQLTGSSAPDGTEVTIRSAILGAQPSGTGIIILGGESFYDVQVTSTQPLGSGANATICITGSGVSDETTSMEYWNGQSWINASNVVEAGGTVCGTLPATALTGTPIVIGGGSSPPSGVPQFPLGLALLFILVPALMAMRKRSISLRI